MKSINDIVFILGARINSSRVIKKMIRKFGDTTLFELAIQKLKQSKIPKDNLYIAVGDLELIEIAKKYDVNIFYRTEKSINSEVLDIRDAFEWCYEFSKSHKYFFWINACQPFLKVDTINIFIDQFLKSNNRSLISVNLTKNYFWNYDKTLSKMNFKHSKEIENFAFNTKFVNPTYMASHSLQIGQLDDLKNGLWLGTFEKNDPELFIIDEEETFDIDYEWQFYMAECKFKNLNS